MESVTHLEKSVSCASSPTPLKNPSKYAKKKAVVNVSETQYQVVRFVAKKMNNWKISYDTFESEWDLWWTDSAVPPDKLAKMKPYQKINHFPGMYNIARKSNLAWNLVRLQRAFPEEYDFFPRTWVLPADYADLKSNFKRKSVYIVKPEASCQGRGIYLTSKIEDINSEDHIVVQEYIARPMLIDSLKFDLRVYVLIAGCNPLRIFMHEDGLVRFATEEYEPPTYRNYVDTFMHLTNYAINKNNSRFKFNEDPNKDNVGHKRSIKSVFKLLKEEGVDVDYIWTEIGEIAIKTLCTIQPSLAHIYKTCQPNDLTNSMCFEILGLDILIDSNNKPWLLEVNHTPSFTTDSPLDKKIKRRVINDAIQIMNVKYTNRKLMSNRARQEIDMRALARGVGSPETYQKEREARKEMAIKRRTRYENKVESGFMRIYPNGDEKYEKILKVADEIWQNQTFGKKGANRKPLPNAKIENKEKAPVKKTAFPNLYKSHSKEDIRQVVPPRKYRPPSALPVDINTLSTDLTPETPHKIHQSTSGLKREPKDLKSFRDHKESKTLREIREPREMKFISPLKSAYIHDSISPLLYSLSPNFAGNNIRSTSVRPNTNQRRILMVNNCASIDPKLRESESRARRKLESREIRKIMQEVKVPPPFL
jgi:tubulin polyglutamylase TTLL6/13